MTAFDSIRGPSVLAEALESPALSRSTVRVAIVPDPHESIMLEKASLGSLAITALTSELGDGLGNHNI
jgi:hypothetical protein